jgi:hypothetical protein
VICRGKRPDRAIDPGILFRPRVYLPLQQSGVQPPWQQSLHFSVQQEVQQAFVADVCAKAVTVRTTATERTAKKRFI